MPQELPWNWDERDAQDNVVHQSVPDTDHTNSAILKRGYDIENPYLQSYLVGYWPLQEDSGSTAHDFSGNNNDGTIEGAILGANGLLGTSAYSFDGTDDRVSIGSTAFGTLSTYCIAAWVYPTSSTAGDVVCFADHVSLGWDDLTPRGFSMRSFGDNTGSIGPTGLGTDTWHFVMAYYTPSTEFGVSVNGGAFDTVGTSDGDGSNSEYNIGSARAGAADTRFFTGRIGPVLVYEMVPTQSDAQSLYNVVAGDGSWQSTGKQA